MKKYSALILDLDGTTIQNDLYALPSPKVKEAIVKAREKIHIGVATARPYFQMSYLIDELRLSGPSIIHNGAQIIDFSTNKIYRQHKISKRNIHKVYLLSKKMKIPLWIDEEEASMPATEKNTQHTTLGAIAFNIPTEKEADTFIEALSFISEIAVHKSLSWKKGHFDVGISDAEATKQHGIYEIAKILRIGTHEIIGVGDGYNDFPLLMACGLKIAIGNAVSELKAIADYIAPSVDEDGVSDVIEKFIL